MKRLLLALALFLVASSAHAATKIDDLPFAPTASTMSTDGMFSRYDQPYAGQCLLATRTQRAIALRWVAGESAIERSTFSMFRKDEQGHLELQEPAWAYEPIVRWENVNKVVPVKIAENGSVAVFAYREADAVVLVIPGKSGTIATTAAMRGQVACSMATIVLSSKPASECKTTMGCGRFAQANGDDYTVTAGVLEGAVSATIRLRASK